MIVMLFEVAGLSMVQPALEFRIHLTWSLFAGIYEKTGLLGPELLPLTCHWYDGVLPPLTGEAINVTGFPVQTGFSETETVTETVEGGSGLMIMTKVLDVAGLPVAQFASEVRTQVTTSPLEG